MGALMKAAARERKLTQEQIGGWFGKEAATIGHYFSGRNAVPSEIAPELARGLGLEPEEISEAYRAVMAKAGRAPAMSDAQEAIGELRNELRAQGAIIGVMALVMASHRPREAAELRAELQNRLPPDVASTQAARGLAAALDALGESPSEHHVRRRRRRDS